MDSYLKSIDRYLRALERGDADTVAELLHPDVVQTEHPNALAPRGAQRGYAEMLRGVAQGAAILRSQHFIVQSAVVEGDRAAVEHEWEGTLSARLSDALTEGKTLRARFAVFVEFRDGRIYRQANYDCFDPW